MGTPLSILKTAGIVSAGLLAVAAAEAQLSTATSAKLSGTSYLSVNGIPPTAVPFLQAYGTRLQIPGSERLAVTGTVTGSLGIGAATITWQVPGNVRLDLVSASLAPLVFVLGSGVTNASTLSQAQADVVENLSSDSEEAFLYTFRQQIGHRLLATRVRTDNGKTVNYTGPYYDVYENVGPVPSAANAVRQKWYFFDSGTHLLYKTRYVIQRNGANLTVECQFTNWATQGGQAYPGQIVRTENGTTVFTFKALAAVVGPALNDSLFPIP